MKELTDTFLAEAAAQKIGYGDIRTIGHKTESITVKNGAVDAIAKNSNYGFGIRVLHKGCWGFASSHLLEKAEVARITRLACEMAEAASLAKKEDVRLAEQEPHVDKYVTPIEKDAFAVSLETKMKLLMDANANMRKVKGVTNAISSMDLWQEDQIFCSTDGAFIEQTIIESGAGIEATAIKDGEMQRRSFPNSFRGHYQTRGWEFIESLGIVENAERIAEESVALLSADELPANWVTTLVLDAPQLALQVHESIGHPLELDRVLGSEAAYAGMSFATPEKLGNFRYGSKIMHVTHDSTLPGGLGTFGYDDEGVKAQRVDLIKDGVLLTYLTSRETAPVIGKRSNGTMRADGWNRYPIIRMTNINLEPGEWDFDALIADTKEGVYMSTNRSWSIDDKRLNFQFGTEIAYEIVAGKLGRMFKNPNYTGITPEFWGSLDAVCGRKHWHVWGTPNCGKGQPSQTAHVAHGTAPARFRNVRVGVKG